MSKESKNAVGLFPVTYENQTIPGGVSFKVSLVVSTVNNEVSGIAHITQATNPPVNITSKLNGDYTYMCTTRDCHILVTATGYPEINWPAHAGIGPVIPANVKLRMILEDDWSAGTVTLRYRDSEFNWHEATFPVKAVQANAIPVAQPA